MPDLRAALPVIVPKALRWAESQSAVIARFGRPLETPELAIATGVGVKHPERIRLSEVIALPPPDDPDLRRAAMAAGILGPNMIGMTFGYGVYVCRGHQSMRLLAHEFRHVQQYEAAGSIAALLPTYLEQVATFGYHDAPLECDARAWEPD